MSNKLDMNVDYKIIVELQNSLKQIDKSLDEINSSLSSIIVNGNEFLSGYRYQKVSTITGECVKENESVKMNINGAIRFLNEIEHLLNDYSKCSYEGE